MFCRICGKEFEGNFCPECGTEVVKMPEPRKIDPRSTSTTTGWARKSYTGKGSTTSWNKDGTPNYGK